jgi:hypothetical protein
MGLALNASTGANISLGFKNYLLFNRTLNKEILLNYEETDLLAFQN